VTLPANSDTPPAIDTSVAHPARRYNYWLGGKDNFAADRASGDRIAELYPQIIKDVEANRHFLGDAVRWLTQTAGIRQFLDIGTGMPSAGNTHEVAQAIAPETRVVYVDNDPLVMVHARALLTSTNEGRTAYIHADLREAESILKHPDLAATLDTTQPVALMLVAVLHFLTIDDEAYGSVRTLIDALPTGSFVVISHATADFISPETAAALKAQNAGIVGRSRKQVGRFLDGLDLVAPGLTTVDQWRPDPHTEPTGHPVSVYGAVGRKPLTGVA
jgi:hypothetical protein